ncbi:MAG: hypothetical protein AAGI38_16030, partial [Bacteroidota bacterium]
MGTPQIVDGDTLLLGIGTGFTECQTPGQDELLITETQLFSDRSLIHQSDTIPAGTNLLNEDKIKSYVSIMKNEDSFTGLYQYIVTLER